MRMLDSDCWDWLTQNNQFCLACDGSDNGDAPAVYWIVILRDRANLDFEAIGNGRTPCAAIRSAARAHDKALRVTSSAGSIANEAGR